MTAVLPLKSLTCTSSMPPLTLCCPRVLQNLLLPRRRKLPRRTSRKNNRKQDKTPPIYTDHQGFWIPKTSAHPWRLLISTSSKPQRHLHCPAARPDHRSWRTQPCPSYQRQRWRAH